MVESGGDGTKKTYKVKPSKMQRKAVELMVENGGNASKAMKDAGYSEKTAKTPQKLTESRAFEQLTDDLGLTDSLLINALVQDIRAKKGRRVKEIELGAKIKGLLKDKGDSSSVNVTLTDILRKHEKEKEQPEEEE